MNDEELIQRPLGQLMHYAAQIIPQGWSILVTISLNYGEVTLEDQEGNVVDFPSNNGSIEESFHDAIEYAIAKGVPR